jgi:hypothetical protein
MAVVINNPRSEYCHGARLGDDSSIGWTEFPLMGQLEISVIDHCAASRPVLQPLALFAVVALGRIVTPYCRPVRRFIL